MEQAIDEAMEEFENERMNETQIIAIANQFENEFDVFDVWIENRFCSEGDLERIMKVITHEILDMN